MKNYDFDKITDRRNTDCLKYDFAVERGYAPDVLPFWVADMDFPTAPAIIDALVAHSRYGIFGYTNVKDGYREVLRHWFLTQHGWTPAAGSRSRRVPSLATLALPPKKPPSACLRTIGCTLWPLMRTTSAHAHPGSALHARPWPKPWAKMWRNCCSSWPT